MSAQRLRTTDRGFTLTELLVAIGVILILSTLTLMSVKKVSADARISSGVNAVKAALTNARAFALKSNRPVAVVFRSRWDGESEQYVEIVLAEWTGETFIEDNIQIDRMVPVSGVIPKRLPRGIKVAGPRYGETTGEGPEDIFDNEWITQSHLPAVEFADEVPGQLIAIIYDGDGTVVSRNARSNTDRFWVDFNNDYIQPFNGGSDFAVGFSYDWQEASGALPTGGWGADDWYWQRAEDDEPVIEGSPFLAVYDDADARERYDTGNWSNALTKNEDITQHITGVSERIHFNRYTGVMLQ